MNFDTQLALIFRFGMVFVYGYLLFYFGSAYKKSKSEGFTNTFFLGFMYLFGIVIAFHLLYGSYELYIAVVDNPINFKGYFPWYDENTNQLGEFTNQVRPMFLIFYSIMNFVLVTLVFPLEQAIGWKKTPVSQFIVFCGVFLFTTFIPVLSYSLFAYIPIIFGFLGIFLGFLINIGVNIKLFRISAGFIRKRSFFAILGFIFLAFGMLWSMEVGFGVAIFGENFTPYSENKIDIVIGSCIQILGVICYRIGFSMTLANETK